MFSGLRFAPDAAILAAFHLDPASRARSQLLLRAIGRLKPGVSIDAARVRLDAPAARFEADGPVPFGETATDPAALAAAAPLASPVPPVRATRIVPVEASRAE